MISLLKMYKHHLRFKCFTSELVLFLYGVSVLGASCSRRLAQLLLCVLHRSRLTPALCPEAQRGRTLSLPSYRPFLGGELVNLTLTDVSCDSVFRMILED